MPPICPTSTSAATCPRRASSNCSPPGTSTSSPCAAASPAPACRRRRTRPSRPAARSSRPIDPGTAVPALLAVSGGGVSVAPEDAEAFTAAIASLVDDPDRRAEMGRRGRDWVVTAATPAAVAEAYETLVNDLAPVARARLRFEGPPVAFRPRGTIIVVDQESFPAGSEGQGQARPLPGRHAVPAGRRNRAGARPGLIVYARASQPAADASAPQPGIDHWHGAYGFQICTDTPQIISAATSRTRDSAGNYVYPDFVTTGVHSHDDGIIHWHPYGYRAAGHAGQARRVPRQLRRDAHRRQAGAAQGSAQRPAVQTVLDARVGHARLRRISRSRTKRASSSATARTPR